MYRCEIEWQCPLRYARAVANQKQNFVFLYSSHVDNRTARNSILAIFPDEEIIADDFEAFNKVLTSDQLRFKNSWFGYLSYELKHALEQHNACKDSFINLPRLWMIRFKVVLVFDHLEQTCVVFYQEKSLINEIPTPVISEASSSVIQVAATDFYMPTTAAKIKHISSNMSKASYMYNVDEIKRAIVQGQIYQANLTRKFFGELESGFDPFEIFTTLCQISPAPYSSYLNLNQFHIISSSPEQFLSLDATGYVTTSPIKGSAPRFADPKLDQQARSSLAGSVKDQAENLMIVDLMRNDFARGSIPGSVVVKNLFDVTSYAMVHHMSSTVAAQKLTQVSPLTFVKNAFPPGSMTGAPKIKAIDICARLEGQCRGVYAGAIGCFGGDGSVDLSVVIRTLILDNNKFEFQVGGAIVADSTPEGEWYETLVKARGIAKTLGIVPDTDLTF